MNKKIFGLISLVLLFSVHSQIWSWDIYSQDKNIFVGNIVFPQNLKNIPHISLYQRGLKIQAEIDNSGKKIQFTISEEKKYKKFHFLIAQYIQPKIENNTVKYLKIGIKQSYKLYKLELVEIYDPQKSRNKKESNFYHWEIKEKKIGSQRIIPDDTLIIIFNPQYIEKIEGGSNFELPKIFIKNDILKLAGSEEKLCDEVNELLMASLDLNIFHTKPISEIKSVHKKKLTIAMSYPE